MVGFHLEIKMMCLLSCNACMHARDYKWVRRYPGRITELRGCNDDALWVPPRSAYPPFEVVRVKDYDLLWPNDPYAPRKRPHSLAYLVQHLPGQRPPLDVFHATHISHMWLA